MGPDDEWGEPVVVWRFLLVFLLLAGAGFALPTYYSWGYTDEGKIVEGHPTYLMFNGVWDSQDNLNFTDGSWPYLVEDYTTYWKITADGKSFRLPQKSWIDYEFGVHEIKETIHIPTLQSLIDRSVVHNATVRYIPLDFSPSIAQTQIGNMLELGRFRTGDFWIRDNSSFTNENGTFANYSYYDVDNHYELKVVNGEIRLYFDDLAWFQNAQYPLLIDPSWIENTTTGWSGTFDQAFQYGDGSIKLSHNQTGLVGWWTFDEGTGSTAYDYSGNTNTGTLIAMEEGDWTTLKYGYALTFDGTEHVALGWGASLNTTQNITVAAWINGTGRIATKHASSSYGWVLTHGEWNTDISGWKPNAINNPPAANSISHVVGTYDGSYKRAYVNGVEDSGGTLPYSVSGIVATSTEEARIARGPFGTFIGKLDEIYVYNRSLTAAEINATKDGQTRYRDGNYTQLSYDAGAGNDWKNTTVTFTNADIAETNIYYAVNNDNTTWNFALLQANATSGTTYTIPVSGRYLRIRGNLNTTNGAYTDSITEIQSQYDTAEAVGAAPPDLTTWNCTPGNTSLFLSTTYAASTYNRSINYGTTTALGTLVWNTTTGSTLTNNITGLNSKQIYFFNFTNYNSTGSSKTNGTFNCTTLDLTPPTITWIQQPNLNLTNESNPTYLFNISDPLSGVNWSQTVFYHGVNNTITGSMNYSYRYPNSTKQPARLRGQNRNEGDAISENNAIKLFPGDIVSYNSHRYGLQDRPIVKSNGSTWAEFNFTVNYHHMLSEYIPVDRTDLQKENKTNQFFNIYKDYQAMIKLEAFPTNMTNASIHLNLNIDDRNSTKPLEIYFCNNSINPATVECNTNANCGFYGSRLDFDVKDRVTRNSSYITIHTGTDANGILNLNGGIKPTDTMYVCLNAGSQLSFAYKLYYANDTVADNTNFNETNYSYTANKWSWTNRGVTPDTIYSAIAANFSAQYYIHACDNAGNCINSTIQYDLFGIPPNQPPTTPLLLTPLQGYNISGTYDITWQDGTDPEGDPFNITILLINGTDLSVISTLADNNIPNGTQTFSWDTTAHPDWNGYRLYIYACDANGFCSGNATSGGNFTIDNTIPSVVINTPTNTTYDTLNIALSTTITDTNLQSCAYSLNNWVTNTSFNCASATITGTEGSNTLHIRANDTAGNINTTEQVSFTITLPPAAPAPSLINWTCTPGIYSLAITAEYNASAYNASLNYGNTTALGTILWDTTSGTSFSFTPSSLSANTTYYLNFTSYNSTGDYSINGTYNCTTNIEEAPPEITASNIWILAILLAIAIILYIIGLSTENNAFKFGAATLFLIAGLLILTTGIEIRSGKIAVIEGATTTETTQYQTISDTTTTGFGILLILLAMYIISETSLFKQKEINMTDEEREFNDEQHRI